MKNKTKSKYLAKKCLATTRAIEYKTSWFIILQALLSLGGVEEATFECSFACEANNPGTGVFLFLRLIGVVTRHFVDLSQWTLYEALLHWFARWRKVSPSALDLINKVPSHSYFYISEDTFDLLIFTSAMHKWRIKWPEWWPTRWALTWCFHRRTVEDMVWLEVGD